MSGTANDDWVQCPPGELSRLAARLRGRRQRRVLMQAGAAVAVFAIAVGGWFLWPSPRPTGEYDFAGIKCSRVVELAQAYAAGNLTPDQREQVRQHVAQCPSCGPRFKEMGLTVGSMSPASRQPSLFGEEYLLVASAIPKIGR